MGFEKDGARRVGRQKIRRDQLPALNLYPRNHSERKSILRSLRLWILEIPRAVGIRSHIQDRIFKYEGLDDHLAVQKRTKAKFSINPRHLDDKTARKYRRVLHAEIINVNGEWKKGERQSPDFDLFSSFLLKKGDHLGPVAIHSNKRGSEKNKREQK